RKGVEAGTGDQREFAWHGERLKELELGLNEYARIVSPRRRHLTCRHTCGRNGDRHAGAVENAAALTDWTGIGPSLLVGMILGAICECHSPVQAREIE